MFSEQGWRGPCQPHGFHATINLEGRQCIYCRLSSSGHQTETICRANAVEFARFVHSFCQVGSKWTFSHQSHVHNATSTGSPRYNLNLKYDSLVLLSKNIDCRDVVAKPRAGFAATGLFFLFFPAFFPDRENCGVGSARSYCVDAWSSCSLDFQEGAGSHLRSASNSALSESSTMSRSVSQTFSLSFLRH